MRVIIFRHGETDANKGGVCQSQGSCPLNEIGIKQAEALRSRLEGRAISVIFSSPLERALQTAEIVAEGVGAKVVKIENLREMNCGDVEGMSYDEFYSRYASIFGPNEDVESFDFLDGKVPGGESRREVLDRWFEVLDYIKDNFKADVVGIATHYGVMKAVLFYYLGIDLDEIENCEFFEVEI